MILCFRETQVKEIARAVRERSGGMKLGGATPQNTIVGQLSKGASRRERARASERETRNPAPRAFAKEYYAVSRTDGVCVRARVCASRFLQRT
jgi:hypothetical protein